MRTVAPVLNSELIEPPPAKVSVELDRNAPAPLTTPKRSSPLVATTVPALTTAALTAPQPLIERKFVIVPLNRVPPASWIVPLLFTTRLLLAPTTRSPARFSVPALVAIPCASVIVPLVTFTNPRFASDASMVPVPMMTEELVTAKTLR